MKKRPTSKQERRMMRILKLIHDEKQEIAIGMRPWQLWLIVSSLQFTIRNAGGNETHVEMLTTLAIQLSMVIRALYPDAGFIIDMGFDPDYDLEHDDDRRKDNGK